MTKRGRRESIPRGLPFVTTTQAAYLLGVSVRTLWRLVKDGRIAPAFSCGTANIYNKRDVMRLRARLGATP